MHNVQKFTHVFACSVAFKRGVRDGDCDRARTTALGINGSALQGGCHVPPHHIQQQRAGSEFREGSWKQKTATHPTYSGGVALKNACLNFQSAATDENCSSLKQFEFPPRHMEQRERVRRVLRTDPEFSHSRC